MQGAIQINLNSKNELKTYSQRSNINTRQKKRKNHLPAVQGMPNALWNKVVSACHPSGKMHRECYYVSSPRELGTHRSLGATMKKILLQVSLPWLYMKLWDWGAEPQKQNWVGYKSSLNICHYCALLMLALVQDAGLALCRFYFVAVIGCELPTIQTQKGCYWSS